MRGIAGTVFGLFLFSACVLAPYGDVDQPCFDNRTCNPGLVCDGQNKCVKEDGLGGGGIGAEADGRDYPADTNSGVDVLAVDVAPDAERDEGPPDTGVDEDFRDVNADSGTSDSGTDPTDVSVVNDVRSDAASSDAGPTDSGNEEVLDADVFDGGSRDVESRDGNIADGHAILEITPRPGWRLNGNTDGSGSHPSPTWYQGVERLSGMSIYFNTDNESACDPLKTCWGAYCPDANGDGHWEDDCDAARAKVRWPPSEQPTFDITAAPELLHCWKVVEKPLTLEAGVNLCCTVNEFGIFPSSNPCVDADKALWAP